MSEIRLIEGDLTIRESRFCVVASRFNSFIVEQLIKGAVDTLKRHGAKEKDITIVKTPGAFELPIAVQRIAAEKHVDGIIALGAVIRGATPHFEYVAGECVKGISSVSLRYDVPVSFGILTVDTLEQAVERAGSKAGNKGVEAASSAIEMVNLLKLLKN